MEAERFQFWEDEMARVSTLAPLRSPCRNVEREDLEAILEAL
jgi:hypothetical protein